MLVWTDLETTGVNLEKDVILEVAVVITDDELMEIAAKNFVINHETLPPMAIEVVEMHTNSKLLEEVKASKATLHGTTDLILEFVEKNLPKGGDKVPLAGNNIGFDRKFLDKYMTKVNRYFHFRSVDVSSINELAKRWFPEVLKRLPDKKFAHRAMGDIRESINELRFYKKEIFTKLPEKGKTLSLF